MFFKNQKLFDTLNAEIRQQVEENKRLKLQIEQANEEIDRITVAADRVAIVLNEQADKDRVIKRDLMVAVARLAAAGWSNDLAIPEVPDDVLMDVIMLCIHAKQERGQTHPTLVMSHKQIATVRNLCSTYLSFPVAEGKTGLLFGCEVVAK